MEESEKSKLADEITGDFERRREKRRSLECGWRLNMNFMSGMQYCDVGPDGEIYEEEKRYYWQSRRVFNHIAPVIDSRLAKFAKMRAKVRVKPASEEERDIYAAELSDGIIDCVMRESDFYETVARATAWSEICGTAFYKVIWNDDKGIEIGATASGVIKEGDVDIIALSPFEIYPDDQGAESMDELNSLIHARVVDVKVIKEVYGVELPGRKIDEFALSPYSTGSTQLQSRPGGAYNSTENSEIIIERYTKPDSENKYGKLEIVAGRKLLYSGELPYKNGRFGERGFPFVMQRSMDMPGAFFGGSIVERLIPVQRSYNAVRNRKQEFLNRIAMGVVAVEEGAVDTDVLEAEGLSPGKILVYRQGSTPPDLLDVGDIPNGFVEEENRLEKEFLLIGETTEFNRDENSAPSGVTSATGLRILLDSYNEKLTSVQKNINKAMTEVGRHILCLYKQYAGGNRSLRYTGNDKKVKQFFFNASDLRADDVVIEVDETSTPANVRAEILQMIELGLLNDEDGKISKENKSRVLTALGFGSFEPIEDLSDMHREKAREENSLLIKEDVERDEYDDDEIHVVEHTRFLLSGEFKKQTEDAEAKERIVRHLMKHKKITEK